jgi:ribosome biogenesis protein MAK21
METEIVKKTSLSFRVEDPNAWYWDELSVLPNDLPVLTVEQIEALYILANKIQKELPYKRDPFEQKMLENGTISDKIALIAVMIKNSVVHNLHVFDQILALCDSKSNRVSELAIQSCRDLFVNSLLPKRELKHFKDQPLAFVHQAIKDDKNKSKKKPYEHHLLMWYVEDIIKTKYRAFVTILEIKAQNMLDPIKEKVIKGARSLIAVSRENRYTLAKLLIRKFSDKSAKLAGMAFTFLLHVTNPTPGNPYYCADLDKRLLVTEVSNFINDPNHTMKSKVYATRYLQFMDLSPETDRPLAKQLVTTFIGICKFYSKQKDVDVTLVEAVLAGIHRSITVVNLNPEEYMTDIQVMFHIAYVSHFNVAIESLRVIWKIIEAANNDTLTRAYYTLLYNKMMDPDLKNSTKISIFLNIVLKSVKADTNMNRSKAIVKRLLQSCFMNGAAYTCSALIIVRSMMLTKPALRSLLTQSDEFIHKGDNEEDEDEEKYFDRPDVGEEETFKFKFDSKETAEKEVKLVYYNPRENTPEKSGAELSALWELAMLKTHFHPSAPKFVTAIMKNSKSLNYDGNPLQDYALVNFLDKFNFKKPKVKKNAKTPVDVQAITRPSLHSEAILEVPKNLINEDERFYYTFMKDKKVSKDKAVVKRGERKIKRDALKKERTDKMRANLSEYMMEDKEEWDYDDLDAVIAQDTLEDEKVDELLMEYGSDRENEEETEDDPKNKRKANAFGYDVQSGHIDDVSQANQDEFQELLDPETEDDSEGESTGNKRKNRWSAGKKMKRVKVERKQKVKKEKK